METGGKEKRNRAIASCLILPYPGTLELAGCKFFENNSASISHEQRFTGATLMP